MGLNAAAQIIPWPILIALIAWIAFWKGWALWLAARRGERWWFVALLVINTLAVLEIIYVFLVAKRSDKPE
jgi:hypothetical protein